MLIELHNCHYLFTLYRPISCLKIIFHCVEKIEERGVGIMTPYYVLSRLVRERQRALRTRIE